MNRLKEEHISPLTKRIFSQLKLFGEHLESEVGRLYKYHHGGPCIPGAQRLFMNVDGYLFPCERVSESSEKMRIGHVDTGFDIQKAREILNIGQITENKCKHCWAIRFCYLCAVYADDVKEFSKELKMSYCEGVKQNTEQNFIDLYIFKELGFEMMDDIELTEMDVSL
jgi:uncharacterized protein